MAKATKINDFRTLNLSEKPTPTKKNVGAVSKQSRKKQAVKHVAEEPKKKNSGLGIAIFFLLLVILGSFIGLLFTPAFNITTISVSDGTYVKREQITSKMNDVLGQNILKINLKSLEEQIKEIPYVRRAKLKRVFPDQIEVTYREREPYAWIKYLESFVLMDKYGYVLEIKKENDRDDLAIIYGIDAVEYIPGKKLEDVTGLKYENLTYVLETAYQNQFEYTIDELNYTDTDNLIISIKELDIEIDFGEIEKNALSEKMNYLNGVLKKLDGKTGRLDISSSNYLEKTIFTERY